MEVLNHSFPRGLFLRHWSVLICRFYSSVFIFCRFKWSVCKDCVDESIRHDLAEDYFAAVKSDDSIELYSISKAFDDLSGACDAVVAKDLLKGLLHDRGKGRS